MNDQTAYFDTISDLLDKERKSVKVADLESMIQISAQISDMLDAPPLVEKVTPDLSSKIEKIRREASRNAGLYEVAISTIKETQRKMRAIDDACSNLNTYDLEGSIRDVAVKKKSVERKF